jgi:hypothetical protein
MQTVRCNVVLTLFAGALSIGIGQLDSPANPPANISRPAADGNAPATPAGQETVQRWVSELSSHSFSTRQRAHRRLLQLAITDAATRDRVERELRKPVSPRSDLEGFLARKSLLETLAAIERETIRDRFLHDPSFDAHSLAGWTEFAALAGSDIAARKMFVAALRRDPNFGTVLAHGQTLINRHSTPSNGGCMDSQDIAGWTMALAIACHSKRSSAHSQGANPPVIDPRTINMVTCLRRVDGGPQPVKESQRRVLMRLLGHFLDRGGIDRCDQIVIATKYGRHDLAHSLCRQVLRDPRQPASRTVTALLALAKIADRQSAAEMDRFLATYRGDERVSHVWRSFAPTKTVYHTQVRDVALAIEIYRRGRDPRECGFDALVADPFLVFRPYSLGFTTDAAREQAHAAQ